MGTFVVLFTWVLLSTCHGVMSGRVTWSDMTIVPITMSTDIDNTSGVTTILSTGAPVMSNDNKTVTAEDGSLLTTVVNVNETGTGENATANVDLGKAASKKTILYVSYVTVPILVVTGVCGNMFTIRVMLAKNFQRMSVSAFLIAMALSDTAVIVVSTLNKSWVRNLIGTDYRAFDQVGCIAFFWAFRTSKLVSSWMVVLICIERFIAVCVPLRSKTLCSKRMAYASIVATVLGASVFFRIPRLDGHVCRKRNLSAELQTPEGVYRHRADVSSDCPCFLRPYPSHRNSRSECIHRHQYVEKSAEGARHDNYPQSCGKDGDAVDKSDDDVAVDKRRFHRVRHAHLHHACGVVLPAGELVRIERSDGRRGS